MLLTHIICSLLPQQASSTCHKTDKISCKLIFYPKENIAVWTYYTKHTSSWETGSKNIDYISPSAWNKGHDHVHKNLSYMLHLTSWRFVSILCFHLSWGLLCVLPSDLVMEIVTHLLFSHLCATYPICLILLDLIMLIILSDMCKSWNSSWCSCFLDLSLNILLNALFSNTLRVFLLEWQFFLIS